MINSKMYKAFKGLSWITLTSAPIDSEEDCVAICEDYMNLKHLSLLKINPKTEIILRENPLLDYEPSEEEFNSIFLGEECGFEENTLMTLEIVDENGWIIRSAVMVYGLELIEAKTQRIH